MNQKSHENITQSNFVDNFLSYIVEKIKNYFGLQSKKTLKIIRNYFVN